MLGEQEQVVVLGTHVAAWGMSWLSQKENRRRKKKLLSYVFVSSMIWLGQGHMLVGPTDTTNHGPLPENFSCFVRWDG